MEHQSLRLSDISFHFKVGQWDQLPFPMMRWCCTRSIWAGMRTSFTSSSSSGLKLEMEIFSGGIRGVRVASILSAAKASLGKTTGALSEMDRFRDTTVHKEWDNCVKINTFQSHQYKTDLWCVHLSNKTVNGVLLVNVFLLCYCCSPTRTNNCIHSSEGGCSQSCSTIRTINIFTT